MSTNSKHLIFDSIFFEGKEPSQRQLRVSQAIKQEMAQMILSGALHHPLIDGVLSSVAHVKISPDLKNATIYMTIYDNDKRQKFMEAMNSLLPDIRKILARKLRLRYVPQIILKDAVVN